MRTRFVWIILVVLAASQWRTWAYYLLPPPDFSHGQVVLYATDWCPFCEKTRALLAANHIPYREYNIETSRAGRAQYQRLAGSGVPVLLVAGEVIRGYQPEQMRAVLADWQQHQATIKATPPPLQKAN